MFPHHENEIAQSEAATGKVFVHYWMHNEHLQVEGKKMSKRFGNFYTLRDLLAKGYDPMAIRYLLLSTHYRQQFNFTFDGLNAAKGAVERLKNFIRRLQDVEGKNSEGEAAMRMQLVKQCFGEAMNDDLNISTALAALFDFVREINNLLDRGLMSKNEALGVREVMLQFNTVLGVFDQVEDKEPLSSDIEALVQKREAARKAKNWKEADMIRIQLRELGIVIEDTAQGIRWYKE
jgi:cysteinyl-tRNA synthetase